MRVLFRVDSSATIGAGHVLRCLTLATEMRERGHQVKFVCANLEGNVISQIVAQQFPVKEISDEKSLDFDGENDWLIVDHYQLDFRWERSALSKTKYLMAIDDLANRQHACHVLFDQNLVENYETRHHSLVEKGTLFLLGPKFSLLRKSFGEARILATPKEFPFKKIIISTGGTDAGGLAKPILSGVLRTFKDSKITIMIGKSSPKDLAIESLVAESQRVKTIRFGEDPALELATSDFFFGTGGSITWERFCLGLPGLVLPAFENQVLVAKYIEKIGLQRCCWDFSSTQKIEDAMKATHDFLKKDASWLQHVFSQTSALCDGKGAERVSQGLENFSNVVMN